MACSIGNVNGASWIHQRNVMNKKKTMRLRCNVVATAALKDQYRTLRINPGASESEVKKAFRQLALQYHPDVCKESNSGTQFHQINEAYNVVMSNLRGESNGVGLYESYDQENNADEYYEYDDPDDMWEEWMGWEGAGIRDYSSHINPYI
ncbi:hypothetical protein IFM89_034180 [Coptis chinensis]|uniref:J domain-containing protein n=1 Tax=Coptis chinensis TaxID=261450 RepID=A0A835IFS0_9MAGN|nr:hypothetical protein IFM89_034180 [Coptis chinensis]